MLKKNLAKILILTLKMCDFANKLAPTAASPSVANSWQNISASLVIKCGLSAKNFSPSKMIFLGRFLPYKLGQNLFSEFFCSHFFSTLFEFRRPNFWLNVNPVQDKNRFCIESAAQMTTIGNSFRKIGAS